MNIPASCHLRNAVAFWCSKAFAESVKSAARDGNKPRAQDAGEADNVEKFEK